MAYTLGCHPSQDASGHKWRFRLGFPTRNITTILVSWAGGTQKPSYSKQVVRSFMISFGLPDDAPGSWISLKRWISRLSAGVFQLLEFAPLVMKKSTSILVELQSFRGSTIQVGHAQKFRRHYINIFFATFFLGPRNFETSHLVGGICIIYALYIYIYCKIVYMSAMNAFLVFVCCTLSVHTRTLQDKKGMRLGPFAPLLKRCGQKSKRPTSPFFFDRSVSQWWRCFLFKNIIGGNAVLFWAHLITGVIEDQTIQHVWSFEGFPLVWSIVWVGTIRKISFFVPWYSP